METEGCYNYPETNTSALCTPRVPLSQAWQRKTNVSHILGERRLGGGWVVGVPGGRWSRERGGGGGEKIVKGMERDGGGQRWRETRGYNEGKGGRE